MSSRKLKSDLKSDNNNGYFTWRQCTFITISRLIILRMRNVSEKVIGTIKTYVYVQ
jgi:hypothetical protein